MITLLGAREIKQVAKCVTQFLAQIERPYKVYLIVSCYGTDWMESQSYAAT